MTAIAVIVPVLGRPQNAKPLVDSFNAAGGRAVLMFVVSPGDDAQWEACKQTGAGTCRAEWEPGPGDYARKINYAYAQLQSAEHVLCGADDLRFHPGWDIELLDIVDEYDVGVVGTNDLANPAVIAGAHATHPLVARCYVERFGGYVGGEGRVYFDGYSHQFVDTELVETAKQRGCYAPCPASKVEHLHPVFDRRVPMDATYARGQADQVADRQLFLSRQHLWLNERREVAHG